MTTGLTSGGTYPYYSGINPGPDGGVGNQGGGHLGGGAKILSPVDVTQGAILAPPPIPTQTVQVGSSMTSVVVPATGSGPNTFGPGGSNVGTLLNPGLTPNFPAITAVGQTFSSGGVNYIVENYQGTLQWATT